MKKNKLNIKFHNPNGDNDTIKFLTNLVVDIAIEKSIEIHSDDKDKFSKSLNSCLFSEKNVV